LNEGAVKNKEPAEQAGYDHFMMGSAQGQCSPAANCTTSKGGFSNRAMRAQGRAFYLNA